MSFREFFLDLCLSGEQPIQCLVEFVFVGILYGKFFGESAANDVDEGRREMRDVAEGFMLDLIADAEGTAEEVGLIDPAFVLAGSCGYMNSARTRRHTCS